MQRIEALGEAYDRRIAAVEAATAVKLKKPLRNDDDETYAAIENRGKRRRSRAAASANSCCPLKVLQERQPDAAAAIRADEAIEADALRITAGAQTAFEQAQRRADEAGLGGVRQFGAEIGGSIRAMFRDPLQVTTLALGGGSGNRAHGGRPHHAGCSDEARSTAASSWACRWRASATASRRACRSAGAASGTRWDLPRPSAAAWADCCRWRGCVQALGKGMPRGDAGLRAGGRGEGSADDLNAWPRP